MYKVKHHELKLIASIFVVSSLFVTFFVFSGISKEINYYWLYYSKRSERQVFAKPYGQYKTVDEELNTILGQKINYWDDWNWQEKMIEGRVRDIDVYNSELAIYVSRPLNEEFSHRVSRMYVQCPLSNTIAVKSVNPSASVFAGGFNVVEKASLGDVIYAYCLDEECLNIGGGCILTVFD